MREGEGGRRARDARSETDDSLEEADEGDQELARGAEEDGVAEDERGGSEDGCKGERERGQFQTFRRGFPASVFVRSLLRNALGPLDPQKKPARRLTEEETLFARTTSGSAHSSRPAQTRPGTHVPSPSKDVLDEYAVPLVAGVRARVLREEGG